TALDDLPSLWKESDGFWNWIEAKAPPRKAAKRRSPGARAFGATMDDGAIVLGTIELGTKTVTLSVNSEARAARGRAMLEPVLAGLARAPLVERQSIEQMTASSREHSEQDIVCLPPDEERSIVHQALTDHFLARRWTSRSRRSATRRRKAVKTAKPEEGDRVAEDAGEFSAAASRGSDGRLRLHVAVARTRRWRRAAVTGSRRGVRQCGKARRDLGQRMANALPAPRPKSLWPILVVRESLTAR